MSDRWLTVRASENQYSLGGYSACAYIAVAAAKKLLEVQDVTSQLLDDCVREGVARAKASGSGSAHAAAYDLLTTSEADTLDVAHLEQFSTPTELVNQLRFKDPRVLGTASTASSPTSSGTALAYFITKPPEVLLAIYFPLGLRSNPRISWVFLDSHPRPNRDLHSSYAMLFAKANDMYDALQGREPLVTMLEYGVEYNNCELLTVKLKRRSEEGKKAPVPSLNLSSAIGLGGSKGAMTPRPFSSSTVSMPSDYDRNRTLSSPGGEAATTKLPTANRNGEHHAFPPTYAYDNASRPSTADEGRNESAALEILRKDLTRVTQRNEDLRYEKTKLEREIERLERELAAAEAGDATASRGRLDGSRHSNSVEGGGGDRRNLLALAPPAGAGSPPASRAGSAPPRKVNDVPQMGKCCKCFDIYPESEMIPFMSCCKRFYCDACVRGRLTAWVYELQSLARFPNANTAVTCPGCGTPVQPDGFADVVESTELSGFTALLNSEVGPTNYTCNCGEESRGYEDIGFHYCVMCGILCKTCRKTLPKSTSGNKEFQAHFGASGCPLFLPK